MRLLVDTHTHTVASGHAYSTLKENVEYARDTGMEAICSADHGPGIRGGAPDFIIGVLASLPESMEGVRVFCSTEANILDYDGHVDIPDLSLIHICGRDCPCGYCCGMRIPEIQKTPAGRTGAKRPDGGC